MSNAEHLANVMVEAFIAAVERGVDLVPVVADSTSTAKIAPFIKQFPGRLVNVGIAEQSMVGTAAGLALGGKVAVTCNAAPFLISRANEQIKVDVCYNNTNVKLFGLNAGASYGPLASTHHSIDDLAVMRGFGNIQIFAPSTPRECRQIIDYAIGYQGPVYIRLDGKALRSCTMKAIALYRARSSRCGKAMISRWWPPVRRCMRWWRRRSSLPTSVSRRKWSACRRFAPAIPRRCWRAPAVRFGDHRRRA
ncbi:1-deoxy-D-xylulose-5-phosphate synthase [Serratia liquefaciens]|nr:1-deoxy-D-xylulose-5-phosphate synthase [Serratia liquefaciens]